MANTRSVFSATNASVQIAGQEVGQLQALNAQINYNLQEIRNLYSDSIQSFPRGITTISLTARRALIDTNGMFGNFDTIAQLAKSFERLSATIPSTTLPFGVVGQLTRQQPNGTVNLSDVAATAIQAVRFFGSTADNFISGAVPKVKGLQNVLNAIKDGTASIGEFFSAIPFDIVVKMQSDIPQSSDGGVGTFFTNPMTLWKFQGCIIGSRSFSLDIGSIIIMEECTISCKKFIELPDRATTYTAVPGVSATF